MTTAILERARSLGRRLTVDMTKSATAEMEKRNGLIVKRPVLNGEEWAAWAQKHGVPAPVTADKLHVTVVFSSTDIKVKPDKSLLIIDTRRVVLAMLGENEDAFAASFMNWRLYDRHCDLLILGATHSWPSFRPHMTLSYAAAGFEISDEALAEMPDYIVLGGEVYDEPRADFVAEITTNAEGFAGDALKMVDVSDAVRSAAEEIIKADRFDELDAIDQAAVAQIAKSDSVPAGLLARLGEGAEAVAEVKKALEEGGNSTPQQLIATVPLTAETAKKFDAVADAEKAAAEQMVVVIASVSTAGGELVKDLHGEEITTQALIEYSRGLVRGTRASQFDHNGDNRNEIVQSLVLSEDIQKALGIDLGYEPLLQEIHVPDPNDWAEVMKGDWGASIRGTMYVEDLPEADA